MTSLATWGMRSEFKTSVFQEIFLCACMRCTELSFANGCAAEMTMFRRNAELDARALVVASPPDFDF